MQGVPVRKLSMRAVTEQAIASGITPLEYMLNVMRAPAPTRAKGESADSFLSRLVADARFRLDAAKAAAPYVHPRMTEVVITDDSKPQTEINILELARKVAFLFAMAENESKPKQLQ